MAKTDLRFKIVAYLSILSLQVYIPLYIIVMSSWVTFWLVKTDKGQETPARTQLGATTVLAVVTIGFGGKAKPQVSHRHYHRHCHPHCHYHI